MASSNAAPAAQLAPLPRESILYTLTPPSTGSGSAPSVLSLLDLSTPTPHTPLLSLRTPVSSPRPHTLTRLGTTYILHSDSQRALVHLHSLHAPSLSARLLPPAPLASLVASHDGAWLAGASALDGHVWLWDAQGTLVASWQAAYRPVTTLRWSLEADFLVTAGEDARISVWTLAGLLNPQSTAPAPYALFTDHSLPITDVSLSSGSGLRVRLFSTSLDGTLKTWHIGTRKLLHTHVLPAPATGLALDPTARYAFVAGEVPVGERGEEAEGSSNATAAATKGGRIWRVDLVSPDGATQGAVQSEALVLPAKVTSLILSLSSTTLLVGLSTGALQIYDVLTSQLLRTLDLAPETNAKPAQRAVTNLHVLLNPIVPANAAGGKATAGGAGGGEMVGGGNTLETLGRTMERKKEVRVQLVEGDWSDSLRTYLTSPSLQPIPPTHLASSPSTTTISPSSDTTAATAQQLTASQAEVATLRAQLERAKRINEELWANALADDKEKGTKRKKVTQE